ncbi:hypothetical protein DQ244_03610 [Blastococcus sp. TBT05-19]|uniref:hypothetical protein n=1 Tax=Blastococcus sp. TBT05-19 TaxID=2250581 RepID=UPI000DEBF700|nr:hypothetical protein [Blastococcus sp. TBT05-19]RBY94413.1 hypothetical protein DQ244_03610 [Blastococcus sp. TBT05-19]
MSSWAEQRRLLPGAAAGALAGVAAKAADESGWRWAADLGSYPAAWVLVVALIGHLAPSLPAAAMRAGTFFAAMTLAYYAWAAVVLGFGWNRLLPIWLALSATAVAAVAAAVRWAAGRSTAGAAVWALAAGIVLAGGAVSDAGEHPVQAAVDVVVAAVLVLVLPDGTAARGRACLLLAPVTVLAGGGLALLQQLL